jgi:hypothetical protein
MLIDVFKLIILVITCHAVILAVNNSWGQSYRWLGIDMALIIVGVFCFGM